VDQVPSEDQRTLRLKLVGQPIELLKIGVRVVLVVLRAARDFDDDDVFHKGLAFV
jgi:hypothetical protein